jgi:hypothetical protein
MQAIADWELTQRQLRLFPTPTRLGVLGLSLLLFKSASKRNEMKGSEGVVGKVSWILLKRPCDPPHHR